MRKKYERTNMYFTTISILYKFVLIKQCIWKTKLNTHTNKE